MRKWTTTTVSSDIGSVSLTRVLSVSNGSRLNGVECWALLGQTGHALQDILLSLNGRQRLRRASTITTTTTAGGSNSSKARDIRMVTVHPMRVMCTTTGRVVLGMTPVSDLSYLNEYSHPEISKKSELSEGDLELIGIYSLAQTISKCLPDNEMSEQSLRKTLEAMKRGTVTLLIMLQTVSDEWAKLVGGSPISRFVAQLCRRTQGWTSGSNIIPVATPLVPVNPPQPKEPIKTKQEEEETEIEFSRMDSNSSNSSSVTSSPQAAVKPLCSSSPLQNSNPPTTITGQYGRRLDYRPMRLEPSPKKRRAVERNPSRLYRVVRPLTEISSAPIPATKRCVGPEFIVMAQEDPILLDLYVHRSRKEEGNARKVTIIMLNGQRFSVRCNAATVTAGEILDTILRERDIKEGSLFTLSCLNEIGTEYWALSNETKLSKIAPAGWKEGRSCRDLTLYQRFKFHPDDVDTIKDAENKHHLYLQLRRDLLEARIYGLTQNMYLSLAGMALQIEFGDFSEDIHGDDEYFMLDHYLPCHMLLEGREVSRKSLVKVHRAHLGQSQSKTELKFCRELQRLENFGFHFFSVTRDKKSVTSLPAMASSTPCLIGIHVQGVFLYERARDIATSHKLLAPFFWRNIGRIQYDKTRFQITLVANATNSNNNNNNNNKDDNKCHKLKFQVSESKAKLMFDLASSHHQYSNKLRYQAKKADHAEAAATGTQSTNETEVSNAVEYREPPRERAMRSLKNKFLSRRQLTHRKLYPQPAESSTGATSNTRASMRRSATTNYLIKRLTHYSSMADNLVADKKGFNKGGDLNTSDKENKTPERNYRYKVYLEPEEDENPERPVSPLQPKRLPLQEKPISSFYPELATPMRGGLGAAVVTNPTGRRRRSETLIRPLLRQNNLLATTRSVTRKTNKDKEGPGGGGSVLRMGTRISLSALHRERLRLTSELGLLPAPPGPSSTARKLPFDIDSYDAMETKSLMPQQRQQQSTYVMSSLEACEPLPYQLNESLSDSLIERFDNMETEESEPERQIVSVVLLKDEQGRLGLKITGTPSGIYVEDFESGKVKIESGSSQLKRGDRIVAINGRSLENVSYANALELVRKSGPSVQFLVSQIRN